MRTSRIVTALAVLMLLLPARLSVAQSSKSGDAQAPVVAVFKLESAVVETPGETLALFGKQPVSLRDLLTRMHKAATDDNVKAVVLLSEGGSVGRAQSEEIRQAMDSIRKAGKDIYVHSDSLGMGDYALFAGASRISVVPTADLWVIGFYAEAPYVRGLLDKLGVKPDFLHCGDYKSAAEIYMREGPSPEADRMTNWLLDSMFETAVNMIATGRNVDAAKARQWIDDAPYTAERAKKAGLIDAVEQRQDFEQNLRDKYGANVSFQKSYGVPKEPEIDFSNPFALLKLLSGGAKKSAPKTPAVGIVYVEGAIALGAGDPSPFASGGAYSSAIRKALDQAAADDNIKAVVLRVDSPGGSAVASEIILDATRRVKSKKPFVVSMGNVAGSGGYYVACASDTIFADKSTITGSIGVVGGKMVTNDMWKKLGITFKEYQRGRNAALMSTGRSWDDAERAKIQGWMDEIYGVFKNHVTTSRGDRLKKPIDELAGGRVYTGQQALELGLIDKIGTLHDAVEYIASAAKLEPGYDVRVVPEPKNFMEKLLEGTKKDEDFKHVALGAGRALFGGQSSGSIADLAMPLLQGLDPHRVRQIRAALSTLDMLQKDGVILTTPELMMAR